MPCAYLYPHLSLPLDEKLQKTASPALARARFPALGTAPATQLRLHRCRGERVKKRTFREQCTKKPSGHRTLE